MAFVRHLKVTLKRAKNINACTTTRARTMVIAKASYKNKVYTTSRVEDLGQNPVWDQDDGTNVFHFDFKDESEYITLELFNRKDESIGVSKFHFAKLANLPPGRSETKTLPVMVTPQRQYGELILMVEIEEQQAMGELGLLTVELREGMIQGITSIIFGSRTTKISAKLIYKHTTYTSGILENMGNRFVWHEDNLFTFIINSSKADDVLRLEVYNFQAKVGECEMLISSFIEQDKNLRKDLSLAKRGPVGNIEVATIFTRPVRPLYPPPHPSTARYCSPTSQPTQVYPPQPGYSPPVPQFNPTPFNPWSSAPSPELYPAVAHLNSFNPWPSPELYPPGSHLNPPASLDPPDSSTPHLHPSVSDQSNPHSYSPSAPAYQEVVSHHSQGYSDTGVAHGGPPGRQEMPVYRDPEMEAYIGCFH